MYKIKFKYLRPNGIYPIVIEYIITANSYEEAIEIVNVHANKRIEKMGGSIFSIE